MIAFEPVPSRRLGHSLGINNIPPKMCTYTCVYCQLGRTSKMRVERRPFYRPLEILRTAYNQVWKAEQEEGRRVMAEVSVMPEGLVLGENGVMAMHDVTRGGILETLLEIAHLSEVGIEVVLSRLPIAPIVSRFAQVFQSDPLQMISSGTLAVTVPPGRVMQVSMALEELGTPFAFVGRVTGGAGVRVIMDGEAIHHTEIRCEEDELARIWARYPGDV